MSLKQKGDDAPTPTSVRVPLVARRHRKNPDPFLPTEEEVVNIYLSICLTDGYRFPGVTPILDCQTGQPSNIKGFDVSNMANKIGVSVGQMKATDNKNKGICLLDVLSWDLGISAMCHCWRLAG